MHTREMSLTQRLADAADLIIDFATLGEYGLEPVEQPQAQCGAGRRRASRHSTPQRTPAALATARR